MKKGLMIAQQNSLQMLSRVRIVHLRQATIRPYAPTANSLQGIYERALLLERFATRLFNFAEQTGSMPKLQYVAWGKELRWEEEENAENPSDQGPFEMVQQHCFSKGRLSDVRENGRKMTVAIPISMAELKRIEPELDILDWDPTSTVEVRIPGCFYDD
jgi:hypothetical protein